MKDIDLACERLIQARKQAAALVATWRDMTGTPEAVGEAIRWELSTLAEECLTAVAQWEMRVRGSRE